MTTTNRLSTQTSPYLLQHAHNPVAWYPWGEEALARARLEERPILLSIGYSACHWCHVMERESFENPEIAALMNRHFVCIKVDREERPDLDAIYMDATQALNHGQGGWPMTVFLTPDQKPFFAGTYFPPRDHYGRPGFPRVLMALAEAWARRRGEVVEQAEQLTALVAQGAARTAPLSIPPQALDGAVDDYRRDFDPRHGGFGQAPKFPPSAGLSLLLLLHERGADEALPMVVRTVDGMARGGMYDQIGGGFCRYSTDERWLVPHFEKMLYDNAQLARVYLATQQVTGDPFHRRIAGEILDYVEREMQGPAGGFYSATDADSEGEEGKFFVFTAAELEALLGPEEGRRLGAYFDITAAGNWEGVSIPHTPRTVGEVAAELGIEAAALEGSIARGRAALYAARERRVHPLLDDKILTAWNGLMIGAFAEGARVLGEGRYRRAAERAADYLLGSLRKPDGRLLRTARGDRAHLDGYLEDYAYLVEGLIDLYEAGASRRYLDAALELGELAVADFGDEEEGPFFTTARGHEPLIVRHRDGTCGATPSPNATLALALLRLARHFDRPTLGARGEAALWAYGGLAVRHPRAFPKTLQGAAFLVGEPVELALVGTPGEAGYEALVRAVAAVHLPSRVIAHHDPGSGPPPADLPLLRERGLVDGQAALYVCRGATCQAPVVDPAAVGDAVGERRGRAAVTAT